ncbi:MAG: undecaprenyl-diphosphate phosphatase [Sulfolobales archaeon]
MDLYYLFLGLIQGFVEWLPVSSKTVLLLFSAYVFGKSLSASYTISIALQGGTVASAAAYFRRDLLRILREIWLLRFLLIATITTGVVGVPLYLVSERILEKTSRVEIPTIVIGVILTVQAVIASRIKSSSVKSASSISLVESILFGIVQGVAALPGVSRSGATLALLLLLGYGLDDAMRLSFLASILANSGALATAYLFSRETLATATHDMTILIISFTISSVVGFLTIGSLISLASRYRYKMTLAMGLATIALGVLLLTLV